MNMNTESTNFTSIDRSRNQFQGEIPQVSWTILTIVLQVTFLLRLGTWSTWIFRPVFEQICWRDSIGIARSDISFTFKISQNNLWAPIPQGSQLSTYESDSFVGKEAMESSCQSNVAAMMCHHRNHLLQFQIRKKMIDYPSTIQRIQIVLYRLCDLYMNLEN